MGNVQPRLSHPRVQPEIAHQLLRALEPSRHNIAVTPTSSRHNPLGRPDTSRHSVMAVAAVLRSHSAFAL